MTQLPFKNVETVDPIWSQVRKEAETAVKAEPTLAGFIYSSILNHDKLDDVIVYRLSQRMHHLDISSDILRQTFDSVFKENPELSEVIRVDLAAVFDRDPACKRLIEPILYYKGFHALEVFRIANSLWKAGRQDLALYLQSQASRVFAVDIHPAATIGRGIMIDHATGVVIGETAAIGDNTSILHNVTLGGSGKETCDRHPKIGSNVMIGAGAKVLGNIIVGDCARIASGSVVLKDVPPRKTVAGVPAKVVGPAGCPEPSRAMNQMLGIEEVDS